jgi:RimJ/RimL family protein N-acetyltransferase
MIFLESNNVKLKVLEETDLIKSDWVGWFNDAERCEDNIHHKYPNSWENQRNYLETNSTSKIQLGVVDKQLDSEICGVISLQDINLLDGNGHLAIMLDKSTGNKPEIFIESFSLMLAHGFNEIRLNKICVGSLDERLIPSLQKLFNFKHEGVLAKHVYKSGRFRDMYVGAVFADEVMYRHGH